MSQCYCGNDRSFAVCCGAVHAGEPAASAEALMRARYAAHVVADVDFIISSTHPAQRQRFDAELTRKWAEESSWLGLEILAAAEEGDAGQVEFVARYRDRDGLRRHHERAAFVREDGLWYFAGGEIVRPQPAATGAKIGRNEPCPCGSGRKAKKCCSA